MIRGFKIIFLAGCVSLGACSSIWETRPSQEMLNMEVAIRAAKEVSGDVLAPELYRLSTETALSARREYRLKNFKEAKEFANQSRIYAEKAEFESIRNGGSREAIPQDPLSDPNAASAAPAH